MGNIVDSLLPEELRDDSELDSKFDDIQDRYDALFVDNAHEFDFVGFKNEADKEAFLRDWQIAIMDLRKKRKDDMLLSMRSKKLFIDQIKLKGR